MDDNSLWMRERNCFSCKHLRAGWGVRNALCSGSKMLPTKFSYGQCDDSDRQLYCEVPSSWMRFGTQIEGCDRGVHLICWPTSYHVKMVFLWQRIQNQPVWKKEADSTQHQIHWHLSFGLLISKTWRKYISVSINHPVWDILLWHYKCTKILIYKAISLLM